MLPEVKKRQKETQILKGMAPALREIFAEDPDISNLVLSRIKLSKDGSICEFMLTVMDEDPETAFKKALGKLKMYAPSCRRTLSRVVGGKYVPEVRFSYDKIKDKVEEIEKIFDKISKE